MNKDELKQLLLEFWREYVEWEDKRHSDGSGSHTFIGFMYWLSIEDKLNK